jgi:geranylgeranyl diphosphate synthase type II
MGVLTSSTSDAALLAAWSADRESIDRAMLAATDRYSRLLGRLAGPIRHALSGGGKRVRGLLTLAAYRACGGGKDVSSVAAAIEIVHAYSLVHDDLPCMDDDVMRRNRPTVHVAYGVSAATISGVLMVPFAVRAMIDACSETGISDPGARDIVIELMRASGGGGMVGGQLLDLLGESADLNIEGLEAIHCGKTGMLIAGAAAIGGIAAGAPPSRIAALNRFGSSLGLAFQIMDDVLDVTSTTAALGKTAGRDTALGKSTYPGLLGLDEARALANRKVADGTAALEAEGLLSDDLRAFSRFVVERAS